MQNSRKKNRKHILQLDQTGQALMEFIVMFPIIVAFVWFLLKVNMAINTSIVGQKHARSHVFLKILNHSDFPVESEYRNNPGKRSVYFLGVAGDVFEQGGLLPAPVVTLGVGLKPKELPGARDDKGEPDSDMKRQNVRIRTAFGICTSRKSFGDGTLGNYCGEVEK